jgi:hypothetical protein
LLPDIGNENLYKPPNTILMSTKLILLMTIIDIK